MVSPGNQEASASDERAISDQPHGQAQGDGDAIMAIAVENRRYDALAQASDAVTGYQRIFLFDNAGSRDCIEIDGAHLKDGR